MRQEDFDRLSQMMADKGVRHDAFELLADLRQESEKRKADAERLTEAHKKLINQLEHLIPAYNPEDDDDPFETTSAVISRANLAFDIARAALKAHEEQI